MEMQIQLHPDLERFIHQYRTDEECMFSEKSSIADAMCGISNAIEGMQVDERTERLLKRAMSVVTSYHWFLELIENK